MYVQSVNNNRKCDPSELNGIAISEG